MARPLRIEYYRNVYRITSRGKIYHDGQDWEILLWLYIERDCGLFGGIHYSTVSKVSAWLRAEMVKDKELSKLMNRLDSHFKA